MMNVAAGARREFDTSVLAAAPEILERVVQSGDLSGAVTLIWRDGKVVQTHACGHANIEQARPMALDTIFRIASMTKPITSVAALMLMEEGKLALGDPIARWAPEFADMRVLRDATGPLEETSPAPRPITVEDLLTHRSGLAYAFTSVGPIAGAYEAALGAGDAQPRTEDAWMKALAGLPLTYPPGERFHYSHATDVLGILVGRIAGMDFRRLLFERIFEPLGMRDTDFYVPRTKRDRLASVYRLSAGADALEPVDFPDSDGPPAICSGGGGLFSTADDYLRFARMLLNNGEVDGVRLLKSETVALMRSNHLTDAQRQFGFMGIPFWAGQGFGLGVSVVTDPVRQAWMGGGSMGAFGWPGAFGTWWQADPVENMVMIYLIQNSLPLGPEGAAQLATGQRMGGRVALPMWQRQIYTALGK